MISDETERKKVEIREKIQQYINYRKSTGQGKGAKKMAYDDEELDGALMNELGSI